MANYDVIGDVHGHARQLRGLLGKLGYIERDGAYRHAERTAVFIGDLIDRGPDQVETLRIARAMVDAGSGLVVLGNHEFNAVAWATRNERGEWCRPHSAKNHDQHDGFLRQVGEGSSEYHAWLDWFRTIPLWLERDGLRIVHACWHQPSMDVLAPRLTSTNSLTDDVVRAPRGTPAFDAIEILLKGPEIPLGEGRSYVDHGGVERTEARYRWWDPDATTLRRGAELPGRATLDLPDEPLDLDSLPRYTDTTPVVYGHYWRSGTPSVETPVTVCIDYSAGKGGDLVAYRWAGETTLRDDHFVAYPGEPRLDEARAFIRDATWTFAVTMADNPHWYVVIPRHEDSAGRRALLELLERYAMTRRWHGHPYPTFDLDGWSYWLISPVVNRKPVAFAGWDGDPAPPDDWLAPEWHRDLRGDEPVAELLGVGRRAGS